MIFWIIYGLIIGLIVKMLSRHDPPGIIWIFGVGIAGSVIGGIFSGLVDLGLPNFIWSIIGGLLFCYLYDKLRENK